MLPPPTPKHPGTGLRPIHDEVPPPPPPPPASRRPRWPLRTPPRVIQDTTPRTTTGVPAGSRHLHPNHHRLTPPQSSSQESHHISTEMDAPHDRWHCSMRASVTCARCERCAPPGFEPGLELILARPKSFTPRTLKTRPRGTTTIHGQKCPGGLPS